MPWCRSKQSEKWEKFGESTGENLWNGKFDILLLQLGVSVWKLLWINAQFMSYVNGMCCVPFAFAKFEIDKN